MVTAWGTMSSNHAMTISTLSSSQRPCYCRISQSSIPKTHENQIRRFLSARRHLTKPIFANSSLPVVTASTASPLGTPSSTSVQLPQDLRNATAIVKAGDTEIYILGVSHVSKVSVRHIQDLIATVNPDTVAVELCRDRTGLLIPENAPPPQRFHAPSVTITGYTLTHQGWPTVQQLTSSLKSTTQGSVSASEIEDDVMMLLSSGLFSTVRPVTRPCGPNGAPAFMLDSQNKLIMAAPLGRIDFLVAMRKLPSVQELSFNIDSNIEMLFSNDILNKIKEEALQNGKVDGLPALLSARAALIQSAGSSSKNSEESKNTISLTFSGVETGKIVAHIEENTTNIGSSDGNINTGLEGTAVGGKGIGIQPFTRQAHRDRNSSSSSSSSSSSTAAAGTGTTPSTKEIQNIEIEKWSDDELASGIENFTSLRSGSTGGGGLAMSFAAVLTQLYANYQAAAGRAVGIGTGAAWQAALESAAQCGAQQVYIIDRPTSVTGGRLAQGIWKASSPFILGAVPAAIAGAIITTSVGDSTTSTFGPAPLIFAVVLPLFAAVWPIASPLLEIQKFSKMSAADIEETVRIKEPLQDPSKSEIVALWGEDALIKWPGAMDSIINERDEYMAKALVSLAAGSGDENQKNASKATKGLTPAYVRSENKSSNSSTRVHYRYAMPKGETDLRVCPLGDGEGRFSPLKSKKIVAVVGTAHVRGMLKLWPRVSETGSDLSLSKFVE